MTRTDAQHKAKVQKPHRIGNTFAHSASDAYLHWRQILCRHEENNYIRDMKKDNNNEIFPVVDEMGDTTGSATRGECHNGSKLLHPVVHLHLFDSQGRIYLQQRPLWKDIQPGKWDTAVGGHVDYGEDIETALQREVNEELGLTGLNTRFLTRYVFESERERELVYVYSATYNGEVHPSDELDGGKFWTVQEVSEAMGAGILTPNFEQEYIRIQPLL